MFELVESSIDNFLIDELIFSRLLSSFSRLMSRLRVFFLPPASSPSEVGCIAYRRVPLKNDRGILYSLSTLYLLLVVDNEDGEDNVDDSKLDSDDLIFEVRAIWDIGSIFDLVATFLRFSTIQCGIRD